ncbi:hypothetical protein SEA_CHERRYONLIM_58 [Gordonia phage CherryonLim]|uniref:Uncharacterized protein n=1 Tax=Gordonia phage CherryonLim TaxID=2652411 RepID=A0A5P8DAS1_9CAUD|nr:hypothetical protein PP994_gp58 [Gordonia phage CherryonLim]QFP95811.1 hypothetical protein SEA_CHERRYONLIM_58 [Gordonia phage CherryonLim]
MTDNVFDKAAEVLEKDGWCKGDLHRQEVLHYYDTETGQVTEQQVITRHCALGAIDVAVLGPQEINLHSTLSEVPTGSRDARVQAMKYLTQYLEEHFLPADPYAIDGMSSIPQWNDAKGRTAQEVIDFLRWCGKQETDKQ